MQPIKVGLVLGAGGCRGLSHIGVLQVLEQEKIPIDLITGCSIGAIIGGIYGCGVPLDRLEQLVYQLNERMVFDITMPRRGLLKGNKLEAIVRTLTKNMAFSQAKLPMAFAACDIETGALDMLSTGNISRAVRASMSIPGIFDPVNIGSKWYVDGGTVDRLPIAPAREMGADMVIAVDVGYRGQRHTIGNIYDIIMSSFDIIQWELIQHRLHNHPGDVELVPDVAGIKTLDLSQAESCIDAGRDCAREALPRIRESLERAAERLYHEQKDA